MGQILGCVKVKQSNVGVKEVYGKYGEVLQPGCHFVPRCFGHQVAAKLSLGFMHFNLPVGAITKDNVSVTVHAVIQYQLLEEMVVEAQYYKLGKPKKHISRYVKNAIRALVPNIEFNSLYQQRNEIATTVQNEIGKDMSAFGIEIHNIFLSYSVDTSVRKAMKNAVRRCCRLFIRQKMLQHNKAEGAAESKYLAQGDYYFQGAAESKYLTGHDASAATSSKYITLLKEITFKALYFLDAVISLMQYLGKEIKEITASAKYIALQVKDGLPWLKQESVRKHVKAAETKEKAEAEKMLQLWRADAESKCLTKLGVASQFQAIATHIKDGLLLHIQPQELQFPFESGKHISCSLQLSNKTDNYVAFKVKTSNPKNYCVKPNTGIVLPRSTCDITVTKKAQMEAPSDMQCKDKFLVHVASPGTATKDITRDMFNERQATLLTNAN